MDNLFCNHDWKLVNNLTIQSQFDTVVEQGYKPTTGHSLTRKYVTDYQCLKCGKLKRFITKTQC